uniref:Myb-like protein M n=1 Tax=Dermatophagoides pteronyssinus TaxID=6956 RepID=A0A6P6Y491_DERPT|nr:myb-like protein M [Dermatophagoides pteronyssinus]
MKNHGNNSPQSEQHNYKHEDSIHKNNNNDDYDQNNDHALNTGIILIRNENHENGNQQQQSSSLEAAAINFEQQQHQGSSSSSLSSSTIDSMIITTQQIPSPPPPPPPTQSQFPSSSLSRHSSSVASPSIPTPKPNVKQIQQFLENKQRTNSINNNNDNGFDKKCRHFSRANRLAVPKRPPLPIVGD